MLKRLYSNIKKLIKKQLVIKKTKEQLIILKYKVISLQS